MPGVPLPVVARALAVWALLFGQINFEVFGRLQDIVQDSEALLLYSAPAAPATPGVTGLARLA